MIDGFEDDPEYQRWLTDCASGCLCCPCCWECPCSACTAGGVCDAIPCRCDEERDDLEEEPC